jgi:hypothetical protein
MKILFFFLFFSFSVAAEGQEIPFQEYFPLKNGVVRTFYVSHIRKNDTLSDKNDLSICKSISIKGKDIFYFDDELNSDDIQLISSQSFCDGVFYFDNGSFIFSPITWKSELKQANLDYFEALFPKYVRIDTLYKYQDGEEKRKYRFEGFETVYIKGKSFKDCLKLTIIQDWKTAQYIETVWFKKGIGVIKWLRGTGRLEEIKL